MLWPTGRLEHQSAGRHSMDGAIGNVQLAWEDRRGPMNDVVPDGTVDAIRAVPVVLVALSLPEGFRDGPGVAVTFSHPPLQAATLVFGIAALSQARAELSRQAISDQVLSTASLDPAGFASRQADFVARSNQIASPVTAGNLADYVDRSLVMSVSVSAYSAAVDRFSFDAVLHGGSRSTAVLSAVAILSLISELASSFPHPGG